MGMVEGDGRKGGGIVRERDGSGVAMEIFVLLHERERGGRERDFFKIIFKIYFFIILFLNDFDFKNS